MGTIYRTTCGCLASYPEPSPAEYRHRDQYEHAHDEWAQGWQTDAREHEEQCPRSAHCKGLPR